MFPIPWNKLFRKKDGSITTLDDAISSGGGGEPYTLPTASAETKGGIKIGSGLAMNGEVLNNSNPTPYSLPIASAENLGGIKVGSGLTIDGNGVLSASGGGGGSKYLHAIHWATTNYDITTMIINNNSSEMSNSDILAFLNTYSFGTGQKLYMASGKATASTYIIGIGCTSSAIKSYDSAGQWGDVAISCIDTVVPL